MTHHEPTYVEVTVEILHETEEAIKVFDYFSEEEHWIPLSQIQFITRDGHSNYATIHVAEWIAKKKGLI
jgi:hypothetical protein